MSEDGINNPELDNFALAFSTPQPAAAAAAASAIDDATDTNNSADINQYMASLQSPLGGIGQYVSRPESSPPAATAAAASAVDPSSRTESSPPDHNHTTAPTATRITLSPNEMIHSQQSSNPFAVTAQSIVSPTLNTIHDLLRSPSAAEAYNDLFNAILRSETSPSSRRGLTSQNAVMKTAIKLKSFKDSEETLKKLIQATVAALYKKGKSSREDESVKKITILLLKAIKYLHDHKHEICVQQDNGEWVFHAKQLLDELYDASGNYLLKEKKVGCNTLKSKGVGERGLEQLESESSEYSSLEIRGELEAADDEAATKEVVREYLSILHTTQDNLDFTKAHHEFQANISDIMMESNSYYCYPDHIPQLFQETIDYVFEMFFGASLDGCTSIFVMERFLNLGSETLRNHIRLPDNDDNRNSTVIQKVRGTQVVMQIQTWEPYLSRIRAVCRDGGVDPNTEEALVAMIRTQLRDGYLQWHTTVRFWGYFDKVQHVKPVDILSDPIYPQVENVGKAIVDAIRSSDDDKENAINEALEPILNTRRKSGDVLYVEPDEEDLCRAGEIVIPQRIQDAINSPHQQVLIEIEKCMIKSREFDPDIRHSILNGTKHIVYSYATNEEAGELWETSHGQNEGKTILIFVICSNHAVYGWNKSMMSRLVNGSYGLTYMWIREQAQLIPKGTSEREHRIMLSFFIGAEGLFGDFGDISTDAEGSFFGSVSRALPTGYFANAFRPGTHALASAVSPTLHPLHIASLMASMGFEDFVTFYELRTGKTIPEDSSKFAEFLAENLREHKKNWRARERELFAQLREIASLPDCMRSESQMANLDEIVITHGQTLIDAFCKCDRIVTQYDEESNWGGVYQQLLGVVCERRLKQYIAYLGSYDKGTADRILSYNMMTHVPNRSFDVNIGQDPDVQNHLH